jgi:uncharacterized damage-inducible protein DinB
MHAIGEAAIHYLRKLTKESFDQIDGVPIEDVNNWRSALGLEDINTFFALLTHSISSGEYWLLAVAAEQPSHRDRPSEFIATGDIAALRARADEWLAKSEALLDGFTVDDYGRVVSYISVTSGEQATDTIANCVIHAVDHTATHLGHLQLQRQIWNAEHR